MAALLDEQDPLVGDEQGPDKGANYVPPLQLSPWEVRREYWTLKGQE